VAFKTISPKPVGEFDKHDHFLGKRNGSLNSKARLAPINSLNNFFKFTLGALGPGELMERCGHQGSHHAPFGRFVAAVVGVFLIAVVVQT
jgi:hypothetical protein